MKLKSESAEIAARVAAEIITRPTGFSVGLKGAKQLITRMVPSHPTVFTVDARCRGFKSLCAEADGSAKLERRFLLQSEDSSLGLDQSFLSVFQGAGFLCASAAQQLQRPPRAGTLGTGNIDESAYFVQMTLEAPRIAFGEPQPFKTSRRAASSHRFIPLDESVKECL